MAILRRAFETSMVGAARREFFGHSEMHHQSSFNRIVSEPREAVGSTFVFGVIREAIHA